MGFNLDFAFGSLELKNSIFLHLPRTGGSWVNHCLQNISHKIDPKNKIRLGHVPYYKLSKDQRKKFCFSFIRHPFDWYASCYNFSNNISKTKAFKHLSRVHLPFEIFRRLEYHEGTKADALTQYLMQTGFGIYHQSLDFFGLDYEIDFIGKYENLTEDLITALEMAGEDFDKEYIISASQYNPQKTKAPKIKFSDETKDLMYKFDRKIFDRFGYEWEK